MALFSGFFAGDMENKRKLIRSSVLFFGGRRASVANFGVGFTLVEYTLLSTLHFV